MGDGGWWIHDYYHDGGAIFLISWIFWVIFSITLHELSHGWAAIWQGDLSPRYNGHMTMNPMVHIPPFAWIMFLICGITWGLMPVNPHQFRSRYGDLYVSAAGPAMNIALAFVCIVAFGLCLRFGLDGSDNFGKNVGIFFYVGCVLNLMLAALNLLPIPPLDGSHMLASVFRPARDLFAHPNAPIIGMVLLILVVFRSGIFGHVMVWGAWLFGRGAMLIGGTG